LEIAEGFNIENYRITPKLISRDRISERFYLTGKVSDYKLRKIEKEFIMTKEMFSRTILLSAILILFARLQADEVTLANGTKITCVVIAKDDKSLLAETSFGTITLSKKSVIAVRGDTPDTNDILRGDFFHSKGKMDDAMRYYGEAMLANPKSQLAKEKYDAVRKEVEEYNQKTMMGYAKVEDASPKVTDEDVAGGKAKNKVKAEGNIALQSEGNGITPEYLPKGEDKNKEKLTLDMAREDALKKIFPQGIGIGFVAHGKSVDILPDGELPNCKIEVTSKEKTPLGYKVTVQVTGPAESVMVNLPPDYPVVESVGKSEDIKGKTQRDVQIRALKDAIVQAVEQAVKQKIELNPKNKNKKYYGRVFTVSTGQETLTPIGYVMKVRMKVWIDPSSEI
jgi:hypothetical protein